MPATNASQPHRGRPYLPTDPAVLALVAREGLEAMSRRQLTETIKMCESIAAKDTTYRHLWHAAAECFRAERSRRYSR